MVIAAAFLILGCAEAVLFAQRSEVKKMVDPYLDAVGELLARPAADRELLDIVSQPDWKPDPARQTAVESARRWCAGVLRAPFGPPSSARFVAMKRDHGLCDTVRCQYQAGPYRLHIAQTIYVLCVNVRMDKPVEAGQALEIASRVANEIFSAGPGMKFKLDGDWMSGKWGRRDIAEAERSDPEWPNWSELIRWWCVGERISYLTLKTDGGPTREVIDPSLPFNTSWFK
jgi:hypothetical protein